MKDVKLVGKQFCSLNVISTRKTEVRQVLEKVSFFLFAFGLSQLTSLQFIQYHVTGFL
jgi:hypothetical protein